MSSLITPQTNLEEGKDDKYNRTPESMASTNNTASKAGSVNQGVNLAISESVTVRLA